MEKHFTEYLIDIGFKPHRYNNGNFIENKINDFSTMVHGGLHVVYIKNEIKIWWGLNEVGKPPTLVSPRPKIKVKTDKIKYDGISKDDFINEIYDDAMNICLKKESNEDIYKALFDKEIRFEYNLNKT